MVYRRLPILCWPMVFTLPLVSVTNEVKMYIFSLIYMSKWLVSRETYPREKISIIIKVHITYISNDLFHISKVSLKIELPLKYNSKVLFNTSFIFYHEWITSNHVAYIRILSMFYLQLFKVAWNFKTFRSIRLRVL